MCTHSLICSHTLSCRSSCLCRFCCRLEFASAEGPCQTIQLGRLVRIFSPLGRSLVPVSPSPCPSKTIDCWRPANLWSGLFHNLGSKGHPLPPDTTKKHIAARACPVLGSAQAPPTNFCKHEDLTWWQDSPEQDKSAPQCLSGMF